MSEQEGFNALKYRIEVDEGGTTCFYNATGLLHRDYGPAVIFQSGEHWWYQTGRRRRNDGPLLNGVMAPDGVPPRHTLVGITRQ